MAFFKKKENNQASKSVYEVSQEVRENSAQSITNAQRFNSWMDEAFFDFNKNGGIEHLPGKGKPIHIPDGDVLNSILKNANVLPPWLETQKEVRYLMKLAIDRSKFSMDDIDQVIVEQINDKIRLYNRQVPSALLQRGLVSETNIREKYEYWE